MAAWTCPRVLMHAGTEFACSSNESIWLPNISILYWFILGTDVGWGPLRCIPPLGLPCFISPPPPLSFQSITHNIGPWIIYLFVYFEIPCYNVTEPFFVQKRSFSPASYILVALMSRRYVSAWLAQINAALPSASSHIGITTALTSTGSAKAGPMSSSFMCVLIDNAKQLLKTLRVRHPRLGCSEPPILPAAVSVSQSVVKLIV